MNKDEKSLLDEIWEASGLSVEKNEEQESAPKAEEPVAEQPAEETPEEITEETAEETAEEAAEEPAEEPAEPEKKKDIKFLAIYTTVFVVVIGLLIAGSYMISYRIHRQMAEANNQSEIDFSQSTLQTVQDQRDSYKAKNETLTAQNQLLTESGENADLLIGSVGDAMEQDDCLIAAQNAYINEELELATALMYAIDPAKLSEPNKAYYEQLAELLDFEIPVVQEEPKQADPEQADPEQEEPEAETETETETETEQKKPGTSTGIRLPNYKE